VLENRRREAARREQLDDLREAMLAVNALSPWLEALDLSTGPLISIITATRNRPAFLQRACTSVIEQPYQNWEWLVVNDGKPKSVSHDADPRIIDLESGETGLPAARNIGLDAAAGEMIVYLDDDNILHRDWLRAVAVTSLQRRVDWGYGARVTQTPEVFHMWPDWPAIEFLPFDPVKLRKANYLDINAVFHRNDARVRFDPRTISHSDWDLVLGLLERFGPPMRVPAISCLYSTGAPGRLSRSAASHADVAYITHKHADS
jgi:glycosyltransferase involved in cell wall biosynthesis